MNELTYICPACGSDKVTVAHIQAFMANTGEHYCHSVKTQDANSPSRCIDCDWRGERHQLKEVSSDAFSRSFSKEATDECQRIDFEDRKRRAIQNGDHDG